MKRWAIVVCPHCNRREICDYCHGSGQIEVELIRVVNEYLVYSGQPGQGGREPVGHCLGTGHTHVSLCGIWCRRGSTGKRFDPEHPRACKECVRLLPKDAL